MRVAGDLKRDLAVPSRVRLRRVPVFDAAGSFFTGISFNCDKNDPWNFHIFHLQKGEIFREFRLRI